MKNTQHPFQPPESALREHSQQNPGTTLNPRRMLAFFGPEMQPNVEIARAIWPKFVDTAWDPEYHRLGQNLWLGTGDAAQTLGAVKSRNDV